MIVTDALMSLLDVSGCCDHQRSGRKQGRRGRERRRSGRDAMGDGLWSVLESVPVPRGSIKDVCMRSECACKCGRRGVKEREGEEGNSRRFYYVYTDMYYIYIFR